MKRDFDLIRAILLDVEANAELNNLYLPKVTGYDEQTIAYHVKLLGDANFAEIYDASSKSGVDYRVQSLTYSGHEFLEQVRNPKVWEKTKKIVLKKLGSFTMDGLKIVASEVIKEIIKGGIL